MKSVLIAGTILLMSCAGFSAERIRVEPPASDELFGNPGMGWQTFGRFADQDKNLAGLPSTSAYFRFYWREIEPSDGAIDFKRFDELLAHAHRAGQKLAFRIMCTGSGAPMDVPPWLKEQGCTGYDFDFEGNRCWVPDYSDAIFQQKHFRLIRELGRRYNRHQDLDLVDIGTVGLWGEWHMSRAKDIATGKNVRMPSKETINTIIDEWRKAFPRTPKVVLIGSEDGMRRAVADELGWRADCLGDMGGFSKNWSHMNNFYLQQVEKTGAPEAWKKAPVAFESCWDMRKWSSEGWDIRYIFDYALRVHTTYVNNKSAPVPDGTRPEVERLLKKMGYRLVLRRVEHPSTARLGASLPISLGWENVGVAPPYRDYLIAVQLRPVGPASNAITGISKASIRGWLPGTNKTEQSINVPQDAKPGAYEIAIGLVDPHDNKPAVRLANSGRDSAGWYPVSRVTIK